ncbi:glutathione S-transferase N-terminal domain-containing protein [Stutzerimonas azotifigens]|uniref:glutathione S-transferase N-terminal domain-containing protein n=1 Tax=Stutzerimonas azotifigens TaxID=291995 RepID=UPI0004122178
MKLVGKLDSPYVRRTAITLGFLDVDFDHLPLSIFSGYERFRGLNPGVKAPLVLDDGAVLIGSTLIIATLPRLAIGF